MKTISMFGNCKMRKYRQKTKKYSLLKKKIRALALDALYEKGKYLPPIPDHFSPSTSSRDLKRSRKTEKKPSEKSLAPIKRLTQEQIKSLSFHNDNRF